MTVTERFATSRYYCLMPVHARGGLTLTVNLSETLRAADSSMEQVVKTTAFLTNLSDFAVVK